MKNMPALLATAVLLFLLAGCSDSLADPSQSVPLLHGSAPNAESPFTGQHVDVDLVDRDHILTQDQVTRTVEAANWVMPRFRDVARWNIDYAVRAAPVYTGEHPTILVTSSLQRGNTLGYHIGRVYFVLGASSGGVTVRSVTVTATHELFEGLVNPNNNGREPADPVSGPANYLTAPNGESVSDCVCKGWYPPESPVGPWDIGGFLTAPGQFGPGHGGDGYATI